MSLGLFRVPPPTNEPVLAYAPGSPEVDALKAALARQSRSSVELAPIVDGRRVETGRTFPLAIPHLHRERLGTCHAAGVDDVHAAIEAARRAKPQWAALPWEERVAVFLRAAALLRGKYRFALNAATMLGQSKTVHQAEIDAACELIDFLQFNAHFLGRVLSEQPESPLGAWNRAEARPLDGFVLAITPFNFTAIAGNLPVAPAMCGNTVLWKPASTAVASNALFMEILQEAGLPPGVINFLPGDGAELSAPALASPELGGVHFTGSTRVFQSIWRTVGENIHRYGQYPRLVGETGGKDFFFVHESADLDAVVANLIRGAFEYQGQKCSAASRAYIPGNLWPRIRVALEAELSSLGVGDVADFRNFMGAVIDAKSFEKQKHAIEEARSRIGGSVVEVLGGRYHDDDGWFVHPTVIVVDDPRYRTMCEELFGPILTVYVYEEKEYAQTLALCDETSPYALTGAIFATDRAAIVQAQTVLRNAAGNFYVNDKPTGAVVGQQPFGGSRASGTNDKAGSLWNLTRWISPRTIKENLAPVTDWRYPFMDGV